MVASPKPGTQHNTNEVAMRKNKQKDRSVNINKAPQPPCGTHHAGKCLIGQCPKTQR